MCPALLVQFQDCFGARVGRCKEWARLTDAAACEPRVLRMRYAGYGWVRPNLATAPHCKLLSLLHAISLGRTGVSVLGMHALLP